MVTKERILQIEKAEMVNNLVDFIRKANIENVVVESSSKGITIRTYSYINDGCDNLDATIEITNEEISKKGMKILREKFIEVLSIATESSWNDSLVADNLSVFAALLNQYYRYQYDSRAKEVVSTKVYLVELEELISDGTLHRYFVNSNEVTLEVVYTIINGEPHLRTTNSVIVSPYHRDTAIIKNIYAEIEEVFTRA